MAVINVPNDHSTIQAAENAANAGDIIEIATGIYYESVLVDNANNLTFRSVTGNSADVIVDASKSSSTYSAFYISNVMGTTIQNLNVRRSHYNGISATTLATYTVISNCGVYGNKTAGIELWGDSSSLLNNTCWDNHYDGIRLWANSCTVKYNSCVNNGHFGEHGIDVDGNSNTISYNMCYNNETDGINVFGDSNTISHNTCMNNGIDGIDIQGIVSAGNNVIDNNVCEYNLGEGIEDNVIIGTGTLTTIKNNISRYNRSFDYGIRQSVSNASLYNISSDNSHDFSKSPVIDSW